MGNVNLKINGLNVTAPEGATILEAARAAGIRIPTLCYLKDINEIGACRMCVVEVKGARNLVAACESSYKYEETAGIPEKDTAASALRT